MLRARWGRFPEFRVMSSGAAMPKKGGRASILGAAAEYPAQQQAEPYHPPQNEHARDSCSGGVSDKHRDAGHHPNGDAQPKHDPAKHGNQPIILIAEYPVQRQADYQRPHQNGQAPGLY